MWESLKLVNYIYDLTKYYKAAKSEPFSIHAAFQNESEAYTSEYYTNMALVSKVNRVLAVLLLAV